MFVKSSSICGMFSAMFFPISAKKLLISFTEVCGSEDNLIRGEVLFSLFLLLLVMLLIAVHSCYVLLPALFIFCLSYSILVFFKLFIAIVSIWKTIQFQDFIVRCLFVLLV